MFRTTIPNIPLLRYSITLAGFPHIAVANTSSQGFQESAPISDGGKKIAFFRVGTKLAWLTKMDN
jgi:hypothetical protein